jgi:hypothetical protein
MRSELDRIIRYTSGMATSSSSPTTATLGLLLEQYKGDSSMVAKINQAKDSLMRSELDRIIRYTSGMATSSSSPTTDTQSPASTKKTPPSSTQSASRSLLTATKPSTSRRLHAPAPSSSASSPSIATPLQDIRDSVSEGEGDGEGAAATSSSRNTSERGGGGPSGRREPGDKGTESPPVKKAKPGTAFAGRFDAHASESEGEDAAAASNPQNNYQRGRGGEPSSGPSRKVGSKGLGSKRR